MRKFLLAIILIALVPRISFSQNESEESEKFVVGQIKIFGNETTKDYIILDELPFAPGDTITVKDLRYAKERIYSLKLFNFVDLVTDNKNPRRIIILVKEAWYIFPQPFIIFRKNSIKYSNYGVNFLWKNFRGRNETLTAMLSFGFDPNFYAGYFNPNFIKRNVRLNIAGGLISLLNKSAEFEKISGEEFSVHSFFGSLGTGYRTGLHSVFDIFVSFRRLSSDKIYAPEYFASRSDHDNNLTFSFRVRTDTRNLTLNAKEGYYFSVTGNYNFITNKENSSQGYGGFGMELRNYFSLGNFAVFKTLVKAKTFLEKENVPYYDKTYFGFTRYIRGHAYDKSEGLDYFFTSAEFVIPLIKDFRYIANLPLLPESLTSTRFEAQLITFFDVGKTFDDKYVGKIPFGYGVGLNLLFLPYEALRFEFAWNEQGNWEFLFGTGFSF